MSTPSNSDSPQRRLPRGGAAEPVHLGGRLAIATMVLGFVLILSGVLYMLEVANGPGTGPKSFQARRSYNQVKLALHGALPLGAGLGLGGLALVMLGNRLRGQRATEDDEGRDSSGEQ